PCSYPQRGGRCLVPGSLVKQFRLDVQDAAGQWQTVHRDTCNYQRLVRVPLNVRTQGLRFVPEATWGDAEVRLFAFEPLTVCDAKIPQVPEGLHFEDVRRQASPQDLAPPESGME